MHSIKPGLPPVRIWQSLRVFTRILPVVWTELSHVGAQAKPLILRDNYFKRAGTISVGIALENQNPWCSIFKTTIKGIFSAFNIGKDNPWTPRYTVCVSSAKAGYKYLDEDVENMRRSYRISWENADWTDEGQSWNLCQSDWDAVLIPVRRAETFAKGKGGVNAEWEGGVGEFLSDYVEENSGLGVSRHDMLAGGTKEMTLAQWRDGNRRNLPPDYYRFDRWRGLPYGSTWDWVRGNVTAEWQIGNKSHPIDWDELQKVMFH